jgi:hypothetical protein
MSTFQLSFKTKLGLVSIIERDGYITDINFRKIIKQKSSLQLLISKKTKIHPRHVGRICGENRLLLFIPCHRVIRSDGLLGGFLAKRGVSLKSKILKIEDSNK